MCSNCISTHQNTCRLIKLSKKIHVLIDFIYPVPYNFLKMSTILSTVCFSVCFSNWDLVNAKLKGCYEAGRQNKKKRKRLKAYSKANQKEAAIKRCLLILDHLTQVKGKHSIGREFQSLAVQGKKTVDIDILVKSRNGVYHNDTANGKTKICFHHFCDIIIMVLSFGDASAQILNTFIQ